MRKECYGKGGIIIIFLIMFIFAVSATEMTVKVQGSREITVNVINPDNANLLLSLVENSTNEGIAKFSFDSQKSIVNLAVIVRFAGKITDFETFEGYSTLAPITIDLNAPKETPVENVTETSENSTEVNQTTEAVIEPALITEETETTENVEETQTSEEQEPSSTSATGFSIASLSNVTDSIKNIFSSKIFYYAIAGIVLVVVFVFVLRIIIKKGPYLGKIKIKPLSSMTGGSSDYVIKDSQLLEAERKIKQAQEELDAIKQRRRKIGEAQQRYEAAKRELEDARRQDE